MFSERPSDTSSDLRSESPASIGEAENFQVFTQAGYGKPVTEMTNSALVVYAMVSIFNSAFVNPEPVLHMVQETDRVFASERTITPIFYLNSRKLQEVTEAVMFKEVAASKSAKKKNSGPLHNAEAKWLDKFEKAEQAQAEAGIDVKRHLLQWDDLLAQPSYSLIHRFVQGILLPDELTVLKDAQVDAAIESESLSAQIKTVVDIFVSHNKRKFQKDEVSDSVNISEEEEKALRRYLAQEFSVFLVLAYLNTFPKIKTAYRGARVSIATSITDETQVQPVLTYPISAANKEKYGSDRLAEKTFSLFLTIQQRYIDYCERLGVAECERLSWPYLHQPLMVADTHISFGKDKKFESSAVLKTPAVVPSASILVSRTNETAMPVTALKRKKAKETASPLSSSDGVSMSSAPATFFGCSAKSGLLDGDAEIDNDAQKIDYAETAKSILLSLEAYVGKGALEVECVYQNGVTCDLKVSVSGKTDVSLLRDPVLAMIEMSVESVCTKKVQEEKGQKRNVFNKIQEQRIKFNYCGHYWQLTTKLTPPEPGLAKAEDEVAGAIFSPGSGGRR